MDSLDIETDLEVLEQSQEIDDVLNFESWAV